MKALGVYSIKKGGPTDVGRSRVSLVDFTIEVWHFWVFANIGYIFENSK